MEDFLKRCEEFFRSIKYFDSKKNQMDLYSKFEAYKSLDKYKDEKNLIPYGYKIYSQNEEDGMIAEIFRRIGTTNKTFVEFGCGTGLENNTLALLYQGWNGLWMDGNSKNIENILNGYPKIIESGTLKVKKAFITKDNINELIGKYFQGEIDLLSVDIDGNDIHIFETINVVSPRVVVMEYNSKFRPPVKYCMEYKTDFSWKGNDNFGSSLSYMGDKMSKKGYDLVGCDLVGSNAFFVRNDLAKELFETPYTVEKHYESPKYFLVGVKSGHAPSYDTLENSLKVRVTNN